MTHYKMLPDPKPQGEYTDQSWTHDTDQHSEQRDDQSHFGDLGAITANIALRSTGHYWGVRPADATPRVVKKRRDHRIALRSKFHCYANSEPLLRTRVMTGYHQPHALPLSTNYLHNRNRHHQKDRTRRPVLPPHWVGVRQVRKPLPLPPRSQLPPRSTPTNGRLERELSEHRCTMASSISRTSLISLFVLHIPLPSPHLDVPRGRSQPPF